MLTKPKVVLVHSPPHGEVEFLNIGLAYLQGTLEAAGHETTYIDISYDEHHAGTDFYDDYVLDLSTRIGKGVGDSTDPRLMLEVIRPEAFGTVSPLATAILRRVGAWLPRVADEGEIFLFSVNVLTQYFAAAMASRLRAVGKRTAAGGPNLGVPAQRQLLLRSGAFDAVVEGDGEQVVSALVERLAGGEPLSLPGVTVLGSDGEPVWSAPAPPLPIDSLARPSLRGMKLTDFVPILSSRGCPRHCAFCSETSKWRYRLRSPAAVVDEMEARNQQYGLRNFHFHDDLINGSPKWMDTFCDLLTERGHHFEWESFCGPEGLTPERLDRMRAAGCVLIKLGVQSFSNRVLETMRRRPMADEIERAIVHGANAGISMRYDMLTCFPGETDEDHRANLEHAKRIFAAAPGVHFSPNPFYLSLGSETQTDNTSFGVLLKHFDPATLPPELAKIVSASGRFPVGFSYGISAETVQRRLGDYGELLKREGKDYMYLGQTERPTRGKAPATGAPRPAGPRPPRREGGLS